MCQTLTAHARSVGLIYWVFICTLSTMKATNKSKGGRPRKDANKKKSVHLDMRWRRKRKKRFARPLNWQDLIYRRGFGNG